MSKVIVFRAFNTKKQLPVKLRPLENRAGKLFTGQGERGFLEYLTEDEKRELGYVIKRETTVTIQDGKVLDLDDPIDAANWKWIQKHPYIAVDRYDPAVNKNDAVFFVDNPQKEAEMKVSRDKKVSTVKADMYRLPVGKKAALAKALGNPGAESMTVERIEEWLSMQIERHPDTVEALIDSKATAKVNAMIILNEAKTHNVITRYAGTWKIGGSDGEPMGNTDEECIDFILNEGNEEKVFLLTNLIKEKQGVPA